MAVEEDAAENTLTVVLSLRELVVMNLESFLILLMAFKILYTNLI